MSWKKSIPEESEWEVFKKHTDFEGGFVRDDVGTSDGALARRTLPKVKDDEELEGGFLPASQDEPVHDDLEIDLGEQPRERKHQSPRKCVSGAANR